ncbi:AraC-like DNA-binding protein [Pseudomonas sp. TE36184]|jgi:AraC-like DNA-binding protein|uniref:AraC family transcriptional regulator n=1 Tax=Pseudomonas TaxID=286 RepID=UPI0021180157|nr:MULTISPECIES: helix-turn-helix transcriptional regulator [Pseudomonas]MDF3241514.1 helix-turn-helix transcriptional regulator [Pseudomonas veronii]WKC47867.1 helix-turn-helix transcriptional regulator [Pseudomonas veronii]
MMPTFDSDSPDALVTLREYPSGTVFARHTHPRGQFAYASTGALKMFTDLGNWVVPPQRAIWVPGGVPHEMQMRGDVVMLNTYLDAGAAARAGLQARCQVFEVSPLLRHLLQAALAIEPSTLPNARQACVLTLLIDEIGAMPELPLSAPLPREPRLASACQRFLEAPTQHTSIDEMAAWSSMSRRTFTRHFLESTGMTFVAWRQQVCLLEATARLSHGVSITEVALELGFSSASAFTALFRRNLGDTPARYLTKSKAASLF